MAITAMRRPIKEWLSNRERVFITIRSPKRNSATVLETLKGGLEAIQSCPSDDCGSAGITTRYWRELLRDTVFADCRRADRLAVVRTTAVDASNVSDNGSGT